MSPDWGSFAGGALSATTLLLVVGFLSRSPIHHWLGKDLEDHKADLSKDVERYKATLSRDLEAYKGEIQRQTAEAGVRHEKVQDRLHEVVPETFAAFFGLLAALREFTDVYSTPDRLSDGQSLKNAHDAREKAVDVFNRNVLYFSVESELKAHDFLDAAAKCARARASAVEIAPGEAERAQIDREARRLFTEETEPALREVLDDFQRLLGVNIEPAVSPAAEDAGA